MLLLVLMSCGEPAETVPVTKDPPPAPTTPVPKPTASKPTGDTGSAGATGDTGAEVLPTVDCAALPLPANVAASVVTGTSAYHGLAFDDAGSMFGFSNGNVMKWDRYGKGGVLSPGVGGTEQFDWSPTTGMLYVLAGSDLLEIDTTKGGRSTLASGLGGPYGVKVGPDEKIYVANWQTIVRVDPATGAVETVVAGVGTPKVMDWSPDLTKLYFGTVGSGAVYSVDLDASFNPVAPPVVFATGVGGWHDGLDVDACGNVYVAEFNNSAMYRITPSGTVNVLFDPPLSSYGHGIQWGSGVGGWLLDAIYVPQPYGGNTVTEVIIGVPRRTYPGPVINYP